MIFFMIWLCEGFIFETVSSLIQHELQAVVFQSHIAIILMQERKNLKTHPTLQITKSPYPQP